MTGRDTDGPGRLVAIDDAEAFAGHFGVSRETAAKFETYAALLSRWQKTINLVAPGTVGEIWQRHFADSAQLYRLAPDAAKGWVDLGSGGGFPGLVLAIMLAERPGARMTLIESDSRKAAFLREVARAVAAPVDILCTRIENASTHVKLAEVDVVTARALAPLPKLLGLAHPFLRPGATALFLKGREAEREVAAARAAWRLDCELVPSATDREGRIVVVRDLETKPEDGIGDSDSDRSAEAQGSLGRQPEGRRR